MVISTTPTVHTCMYMCVRSHTHTHTHTHTHVPPTPKRGFDQKNQKKRIFLKLFTFLRPVFLCRQSFDSSSLPNFGSTWRKCSRHACCLGGLSGSLSSHFLAQAPHPGSAPPGCWSTARGHHKLLWQSWTADDQRDHWQSFSGSAVRRPNQRGSWDAHKVQKVSLSRVGENVCPCCSMLLFCY